MIPYNISLSKVKECGNCDGAIYLGKKYWTDGYVWLHVGSENPSCWPRRPCDMAHVTGQTEEQRQANIRTHAIVAIPKDPPSTEPSTGE